MSPVSDFLLPAVQNPLLYLSINSSACYSKTNISNFPWNLSQNNRRPSMSTTPRPNQHQMSPEPFLFSPLTSLFFRLSCSFLSGIPHAVWIGICEDGGGLGTLQNFIIDDLFCGIWRQVLICRVLSGLKNEHHHILSTVMHSFPWNRAKPGKRCTEKIASLQASLSTLCMTWCEPFFKP